MDGDTTINFFFGSTSNITKGRHSDATLTTKLRFDTDLSFVQDEESFTQLQDGELPNEVGVMEQPSELGGNPVTPFVDDEPPSLESNEHERFASSLRGMERFWRDEQYSNALSNLIAANYAHLVVLITMQSLKEGNDDRGIAWLRRERDTWTLIELLRGSKMASQPTAKVLGALTDREVLDFEVSRSPHAQVLHTLVRWCHLSVAEKVPSDDKLLGVEFQKRLGSCEDVFDDPAVAQTVYAAIRAGAYYQVVRTPESEQMEERLRSVVNENHHLLWRLVSFNGGKPFDVVSRVDREGNAHRASWKLACANLASQNGASEEERRVYSILSGITQPQYPEVEDLLFSSLRSLMEQWSDKVLHRHHVACEQLVRGRTRGEADSESERDLLAQAEYDFKIELRNLIVETVRQAFKKKPRHQDIRKKHKVGEDGEFFQRIQLDLISESPLEGLFERESSLQQENDRDKLSKLRFLAHLAVYAYMSTFVDQSRSTLPIGQVSHALKDKVVKLYMDALTSSGKKEFDLVAHITPYLNFLTEEADKDVYVERALVATTTAWPDDARLKFIRDVRSRFIDQARLNDLLSKLRSSSFEVSNVESKECEQRRRKSLPLEIADASYWRALWIEVEMFRWCILDGDVDLIIYAGNELVRLSVQRYLNESDASKRALDWKLGECVLGLIGDFPAIEHTTKRQEMAEFGAWHRAFLAWKSLAMLEAQLEEISATSNWYERQIAMIGERDPTGRRELVHARDQDIDRWTAEDDVLGDHNQNVCWLANVLREDLATCLRMDFPPSERIQLRDKFVGKLVEETFRTLAQSAKETTRLRHLAQKAGLTRIHRNIIKLSDAVALETVKRMGRDGELDMFREQTKAVLHAVASSAKALLTFTDTPVRYAFLDDA